MLNQGLIRKHDYNDNSYSNPYDESDDNKIKIK